MVCISPVRSLLARTGGIGCSEGAGFGPELARDWPRAEAATVFAVRERKERRCMRDSGERISCGPDGGASIGPDGGASIAGCVDGALRANAHSCDETP
jgi:hypothetical protein